jgi:hypothetical protein
VLDQPRHVLPSVEPDVPLIAAGTEPERAARGLAQIEDVGGVVGEVVAEGLAWPGPVHEDTAVRPDAPAHVDDVRRLTDATPVARA